MTAQMSLYELLKSNVVFQNLDRYQFGILEQYLTFRGIETGEYLFFEGEMGNYVAFVVAGGIEILKQLPDKQVTLVTLKPGDSIGEMALIDDLSRSASAKATQRTGLIVLPKRDFERILIDHPRIGINILKALASMLSLKLRRTNEALSEIHGSELSGNESSA